MSSPGPKLAAWHTEELLCSYLSVGVSVASQSQQTGCSQDMGQPRQNPPLQTTKSIQVLSRTCGVKADAKEVKKVMGLHMGLETCKCPGNTIYIDITSSLEPL